MASASRAWVVEAACARPAASALPWTAEYALGTERREMTGICASCPVRPDCLAEALRDRPTAGFWAGRDYTVPEAAEQYVQNPGVVTHGA
ncbi:WhiB family transcriptional regulator [Brachybacterium sp. GCM10030267]|uniref:WhiB family transcriptional regulator n=1 Tax=Brachybacterium sp. GCM10030267 TaxID=3273381 RepID=UPI00360E2D92